jgi:8-oxo-dGTP diphosphatase
MNVRTLCFLFRGNPPSEILLGLKKTGFGAGKYAGFGGKVESGETIEAATIRELEEEAGIKTSIDDLYPIAFLTFEFPLKPSWSQVVHVFLAKTWIGNPEESDEMKPTWCSINEIPFESMWDDAHYWLPLVAKGKRIKARFVYEEDNETVGEANIQEWNGIERNRSREKYK